METVFGIFDRKDMAEEAINSLESRGYNPKDISIIMKDTEDGREVGERTGANIARGAVSGATTGGVIGAITGLLIGIGAIAVPGIGALLIGGPIAAALGLTGAAATTVSGAVTGVLAGGLVGGLVGLGVPEREARVYEERIKGGAILLAVPARMGEEAEVEGVLEDMGATNVTAVEMNNEERREEIRRGRGRARHGYRHRGGNGGLVNPL